MNKCLEPCESELTAGTELRDGREIPDEAARRIVRPTRSYVRKRARRFARYNRVAENGLA